MLEIEINKTKIFVPEDWDDITLGTYESLSGRELKTNRDRVDFIAELCGIEPEVFVTWPVDLFNLIYDRVAFVFQEYKAEARPDIVVEGRRYVVSVEDKLTLGAWIDAEGVRESGNNILSGTLAVVCRPVGEDYDPDLTDERQAMFAALPMSEVQGVLAFFLRCADVFKRRTEMYSKIGHQTNLFVESLKSSHVLGAGIKSLRIWQTIRLLILIALLRFQCRRFSRTLNTVTTVRSLKRRRLKWKGNSKKIKDENS